MTPHWYALRLLGRRFAQVGLSLLLVGGVTRYFVGSQNPEVTIPTHRASGHAFELFIQAGEMVAPDVAAIGHAYNPDIPADPTVDAKTLVERHQAAISVLCGSLSIAEQTGFSLPALRDWNDPLPYLTQGRALSQLLALEGDQHAAKGDISGALHSYIDALHLGENLTHGGTLVPYLAGLHDQSIARKGMWKLLPTLGEGDARKMSHIMETSPERSGTVTEALTEEKYAGQSGLLTVFRDPQQFLHMMDPSNPVEETNTSRAFRLSYLIWPKQQVLDSYTRSLDATIASQNEPYNPHTIAPPQPPEMLVQIFLPVTETLKFKETAHQAQQKLLAVAFALRAYQVRHGNYPESLEVLVSEKLLRAVPEDPFQAGHSLSYQRTNKDYLLYSVGPDGLNDKGRAICDNTKSGNSQRKVYRESTGDIVAGVNL